MSDRIWAPDVHIAQVAVTPNPPPANDRWPKEVGWVSKLLSYSTIEMTERYAHLAPENLKAAVDVLAVYDLVTPATKKRRFPLPKCLNREMVGVTGFEPATPASRTQYSTRLSYTPNRDRERRKLGNARHREVRQF